MLLYLFRMMLIHQHTYSINLILLNLCKELRSVQSREDYEFH